MGELSDSVKTSDQELKEVDRNSEIIVEKDSALCVKIPDNVEDDADDSEPDTTENRGGIPVDHGWSWLVLLGACLEMTVVIGMAKSSGVLFVAFQEHFRSSSSETSLISTVQNATYSISALMVMTLFTRRIKIRYLVWFGTTLVCIAYVISSQATDIRVLLFSHGILQGFGTAFMQPTSITILGQYFNKRRGLANSIAVSGGSLGGLFLAPLITALLSEYGYNGCMLILAGLSFHVCISAALYRPSSYYIKPKCAQSDSGSTNVKLLNGKKQQKAEIIKNGAVLKSPVLNGLKHEFSANRSPIYKPSQQQPRNIDPHLLGSEPLISGAPKHRRIRTFTESSGTGNFARSFSQNDSNKQISREYMAGSFMDLPGFDETRPENNPDVTSSNNDKRNILKYITTLFDFKLFKDPVFLVMQFAFGLTCSSNALSTVFVAPFARDVGVDASGVANIITIFSAIDLCSRIGIGVIADLQFVRRSTIIGICCMVVFLASFLLKFYTSFGLVVFYVVILGLFSGGYFALFAVIIVDYMTLAKLHSTLGFTTLFHGSFVAAGFVIAGTLRDTTGSYIASFYFLGSQSFLGGLLLLMLPLVERCRNKRRNTDRDVVL